MSGLQARVANGSRAVREAPETAHAAQERHAGESLRIQMLPATWVTMSAPCTLMKAQSGMAVTSIGGTHNTPAESTSTKLMCRFATRPSPPWFRP